jgi:hypothetical protein
MNHSALADMAYPELIWAYLIHLSYNMWADREASEWNLPYVSAKPYLRFDDALWEDLLHAMVDHGLNMVVLDLGDGVRYDSHPEIAVKGAWTPARLRQELAHVREIGLEPIPKLNFSACHDAWLGPYARCVSTETYYRVCADLIAEVIELFDRPRFFHLGMDEETARHQRYYEYVVIRQYDLWWHDLLFLVEQVEGAGVRPWVWSDYLWDHGDVFFRRMPKSVLQSNWYYGAEFGDAVSAENAPRVQAYRDLEAHQYDQVPTGSSWTTPENIGRTVRFCREHIAPERLRGFLQTVWKPTLEECRERHMQAIALVSQSRKASGP